MFKDMLYIGIDKINWYFVFMYFRGMFVDLIFGGGGLDGYLSL